MSSYLMMLYVTLEQESALKNFFLGQGWTFCKPDLSVTTDKLGPSTLKQIRQNQLEPYLETPVAPIYNKKRKPKSPKSKETPPLKKQKSAQKQQSNDELQEAGNVVEGEALGSAEAKDTRLGESSGAENRPSSSRSVMLEDGREVTVKIEADYCESDNNEDGESELKDNDDDVNDHLDDDNDETDVDYNFLEEGEIRLKNEDMSLPAGSQSGESSLLDQLHGDNTEDQSMLEDSVNNETKVEDGAKVKDKTVRRCELCDKVYHSASGLQRHLLASHGIGSKKKDLVCDHCGEVFHFKYDLKMHKAKKHFPEVKPHVCPHCGKSFRLATSLNRHLKYHLDEKDKQFQCSKCPKAYHFRKEYENHLESHIGKKICARCNRSIVHMKVHLRTCGKPKKIIPCEICSKLIQKRNMIDHLRSVHAEFGHHACKYCGERFFHRGSLFKHIKSSCSRDRESEEDNQD